MSEAKGSKALDWTIFLVSTIAMIGLIIFIPEWFWVLLPLSLTYLVKALDAM